MKKKALYTICALCALFVTCRPNIAETRLDGLRFYSDTSDVIQKLENRASLNPAEHFFLAGAYNGKREFKKALSHYALSVFMKQTDEPPVLYADPVYRYLSKWKFRSPYFEPAAYHIAEIFYGYGEYEYVLKFGELVSEDDPSLYYQTVRLMMNTYMKLERHDEAVALCDSSIHFIKNEDLRQTLYIRRASALEKARKIEEALAAYSTVVLDDPSRWQAHTAAAQVYRIHKEHGISIPEGSLPTVTGALLSANRVDEAGKLLDALPQDSDESVRVRLRYLLARKKYTEADALIESRSGNKALYDRLLLAKADHFWLRSKNTAVRIYRMLIKRGGDYQREFARVCYYLYNINPLSAADYMLAYINTYPDTPQAQEFLWLYARSHILSGNIKKSLPVLTSIVSRPENRYYGNAAYWLYRHYRESGEKSRAHEMFFRMVVHAPDSWYTWIEADRIKNSYDPAALRESFAQAVEEGKQEMALFTHFMLYLSERNRQTKEMRVTQLKEAGLFPYTEFENYITSPLESVYVDLFKTYYEAGYESGINGLFSYLDDSDENRKLKYYVMSNFGDMYGNHFYAYLGSARLYRLFDIKENISLFDDRYVRRLFPLAFEDTVETYAKEFPAIEPLQIYAVMKAESAFNHVAISSAGATGLMQVMPATGKGIARSLRMSTYDLKNPEHSIRFGFSYLNWLAKLYDGRFDEMLGGYNAGPGNMNKWRKRFGTEDRILFAEKVPFYETRHYMFKNQKFYIQYKTVYEKK